MTLDDLAARARALLEGRHRAVIGVAGSPGAGKSTFTAELLDQLIAHPPLRVTDDTWIAHVPMDGFHLSDVELRRLQRLDRKGAPDTFDVAGYACLLWRFQQGSGETIYAPAFDRRLEQPVAGVYPYRAHNASCCHRGKLPAS